MYFLTVQYATGNQHTYTATTRDAARAIKRSVRRVAALSGVAATFTDARS